MPELMQNTIRYAGASDLELLASYDRHVGREELAALIGRKRVIVLENGQRFSGWMRYNLFWDNTPFMNLLFVVEGCRGQGYGGQITAFWEEEMRRQGYGMVLTSSQADEQGQLFYRSHGYVDCGSLLLPGEPLEIIFMKKL